MTEERLPGGARLAVSVNMITEWWTDHGKIPGTPYGDHSLRTAREYGARHGARRIMSVLRKHNVKSTAILSAMVAEKFPELVRAMSSEGHEISGHDYEHNRYSYQMTREEERETIRKCSRILEEVSGHRPLGWASPGRSCTDNTIQLLMDEGFLWNSDLQDSDLPYPIKANGKVIIEIPTPGAATHDIEDFLTMKPTRQIVRGPQGALDLMKEQFDAAYEQSTPDSPLRMTVGFHSYIGGKPGYTWSLDRFLEHAKANMGVIFPTNLELAQWWLKNYVEEP
jgi:peptidoglycan/xylan/chitin deacetylase (PgdA/CDA1 family)